MIKSLVKGKKRVNDKSGLWTTSELIKQRREGALPAHAKVLQSKGKLLSQNMKDKWKR